MKKIIFGVALVIMSSNALAWDSRNNVPLITGIVIGSQFAPTVVAPMPPVRPYAPPALYYNYDGRDYYQQRRSRTPMYREVREFDSFCECVVTRVEFVGYR